VPLEHVGRLADVVVDADEDQIIGLHGTPPIGARPRVHVSSVAPLAPNVCSVHDLGMPHPLRDVCIVGVHNTEQARTLEGHDSRSIAIEAAFGALADAGLTPADVDGVVSQFAQELVHELRLGPCSRHMNGLGIPAVMQAAGLIAAGDCEVVATAPWTRPTHEFVVPFGMFTAAEFALMARRHMHTYGTPPEAMATWPQPSATTAT
jgi:acetyl-CoA acetyltransferase